jgi:hypothetical protein
VDNVLAVLRPALPAAEFAAVKAQADVLKDRLLRRQASLQWELCQPEPAPLAFTNGSSLLQGWTKVDESPAVLLDTTPSPDQIPALRILARSQSAASWRTQVLLRHGCYRFEGKARVAGVKPLPYGKHQGAALRIAGQPAQSDGITGDSPWRILSAQFDVQPEQQAVELVCELRASAGESWFETASLKLVQAQSTGSSEANH